MKMSRFAAIACGCFLILPLAVNAQMPGADQVVTRTLDNGLKILVWPDHDIPNVAMYNFVRAGGRNEYPGITGLSHFFEHLMFLGTSNLAPGQFDVIMEANGGANNAYTSSDLTVYQDWFPSSAMEVMFDLEGDRLANLAFDPKIIDSEREVVYSERRTSYDNQNIGMLYEQVQSTAFIAHPYQFPVIGWPSDIENWTMKDLQKHYTTYYAPNNCTLVLVGDVDPEEVFALAEKYMGPIPAQEPPQEIRTVEPEQKGQRRLEVRKPSQTPMLQIAYHIPEAADPSRPVLDAIIDILTNGTSSRLYQRMVDQDQIVLAINTFTDESFDPGLVFFIAELPPGGDLDRVEQVLYEELARLATAGVGDAELDKAKNLQLAAFWRELATINGKADALGTYEVIYGDFNMLFDAPDRIDAVTADQIRDLAKNIFNKKNSTIGVIIPEDAS